MFVFVVSLPSEKVPAPPSPNWTLEYLLNYNEGSSKIRELIENEKLIKIEGEKKIEIRVKYTTFFISGLLAFILGIVIAKVSHYFREKKNAKKL